MSTTAIILIIVAVVVVAVVATIVLLRARKRGAQASAQMGLPEIGALSGATDAQTDGTSKDSDRASAER
jgi:flagellar basal body-associated protein FliL